MENMFARALYFEIDLRQDVIWEFLRDSFTLKTTSAKGCKWWTIAIYLGDRVRDTLAIAGLR